jgi:hypothetical protein
LDAVGVAAALAAALCLATYYLMGERGTATRDPVALTCWSFVAAGLFWAVAAPFWPFDPAVLRTSVPVSLGSLELPLWTLVGWIVVLGAVLPFWLSLTALRHLPPTTAGLVATVEPVLASVVAWLWVEQVLSGGRCSAGSSSSWGSAWPRPPGPRGGRPPYRSRPPPERPVPGPRPLLASALLQGPAASLRAVGGRRVLLLQVTFWASSSQPASSVM